MRSTLAYVNRRSFMHRSCFANVKERHVNDADALPL